MIDQTSEQGTEWRVELVNEQRIKWSNEWLNEWISIVDKQVDDESNKGIIDLKKKSVR
jgi:hypothetical protein